MNSDDFEQRLQRQPLRQIPPEWRAEILSKAHHALAAPKSGEGGSRITHSLRRSQTKADHISAWRILVSTFNSQPSTLLWPSPKAWAGLAAIWLLLIVVNASTNDKSIAVARALPRPAPERLMAWREQERLLTELLGPREMPVAEKPKPAASSPRSERHNEFLII